MLSVILNLDSMGILVTNGQLIFAIVFLTFVFLVLFGFIVIVFLYFNKILRAVGSIFVFLINRVEKGANNTPYSLKPETPEHQSGRQERNQKIITPIAHVDHSRRDREAYPYEVVTCLLTTSEKNFYEILFHILDASFYIACKVRQEDLFKQLPSGMPYAKKGKYRGYVKSRHVDFVICWHDSLKPLVAIELDDRTHHRRDRIQRDERMNHIFTDAGLPLIRFKTKHAYNTREIEEKLYPVLSNRIDQS